MKLNLILFTYFLMRVSVVIMLPTKDLKDYHDINERSTINSVDNHNESSSANISDTLMSSTVQQTTHVDTTLKPQDYHFSHEESPSTTHDALTPAAQNYFSTYYHPSIPPLGHSRPYYQQPTEEPFFRKFLSQQHQKHFVPQQRPQSFTHYDASILGSGDFGILRGGTFYSEEDQGYHQEGTGDYYYSEASNSHSGPATEGFIQKYTYPEEQFAQFRDFADLNTPSETDYSQFVVVYAAKNSSKPFVDTKRPNNIFEQLQLIDEENAEEKRKQKKIAPSLSTRKMKLVKTKIVKKKWNPKASKFAEEDPLLALS